MKDIFSYIPGLLFGEKRHKTNLLNKQPDNTLFSASVYLNLMHMFSSILEERLFAFSSHPHMFDCTPSGLMPILFLCPKIPVVPAQTTETKLDKCLDILQSSGRTTNIISLQSSGIYLNNADNLVGLRKLLSEEKINL